MKSDFECFSTSVTGTLHADQYTFFYHIMLILLRMKNISKRCCREKTHFLCAVTFFLNSAVYEIMCKNILEPGRTQMTMWGMCIACWIPKATNTHSDYVLLIAFLMQQWLHEHA